MGFGWVLVITVLVVLFLLFKFKAMRHKIGLVVSISLLVFFFVSFGQLYFTHDLDLSTFDGVLSAGKIYFSWLGSFTGNVVKVSTYAVKQNWELNVSAVAG